MSDAAQPLHLRVEKPIYGGAGLARHDGKAIFTPYTLPGELVTATVIRSKASFTEAALATVIEPSPNRIQPCCPYFGPCGGCHYQHANYLAQLAMKAAILEEAFTRARLTDLPPIHTHPSEPFAYRNRIRLHIDPFTSALGYRERASHRLLPVDQCPIAAPELQQALVTLAPLSVDQRCGNAFSQVEFSVNHDGSELLLALLARDHRLINQAAGQLVRLCEALVPHLTILQGAGVHPAEREAPSRAHVRPQRGSRNFESSQPPQLSEMPSKLLATWGTPRMTYTVAGLDYRVSLGAFFQVNRPLVSQLLRLATKARSGRLAWDLYAGVGLFSRVLAQHFTQVIAVEGAPVSCEDLRVNLPAPHQAVQSSTLAFLRREAARTNAAKAAPDFVLLDPPRSGLGDEITRCLAQIGPPEITYVSCDPATLARDLRALVDSGYKLRQLHLVDLFPQTFHLETVAMLSRH